MNNIGTYIKRERKKIGLTQIEFAKESGLGLRFVKELEQGKETVRLDKVNQALNYLGSSISTESLDYQKLHQNTPTSVIIKQVSEICREMNVKHLVLFGSYAKGTYTEDSDLDFAIKGFNGKMLELLEKVDEIRTLKHIDILDYDKTGNYLIKEEVDKYGRKIY